MESNTVYYASLFNTELRAFERCTEEGRANHFISSKGEIYEYIIHTLRLNARVNIKVVILAENK